jgi:predicted acetyltransferase
MLVKSVAQDHSMKTCWITCRPDNLQSIRTCEIINAKFVDIIEIPKDFEKYMQGNKQMCRFKWDLESH